jgi:hypothetical protein
VLDYSPKAGPTSGKTLVKVQGMGFVQAKDDLGNKKVEPLWVRFTD